MWGQCYGCLEGCMHGHLKTKQSPCMLIQRISWGWLHGQSKDPVWLKGVAEVLLHAELSLKIRETTSPKFKGREPICFPVIRMIKQTMTICNLPCSSYLTPFNNRALRGKTLPQYNRAPFLVIKATTYVATVQLSTTPTSMTTLFKENLFFVSPCHFSSTNTLQSKIKCMHNTRSWDTSVTFMNWQHCRWWLGPHFLDLLE
jgi:hypothetical protein